MKEDFLVPFVLATFATNVSASVCDYRPGNLIGGLGTMPCAPGFLHV